jgi:MYXO-CTERM domain-containing protein
MFNKITKFAILAALSACAAVPAGAEAALAEALGESGYSGTLSSNRAIRKQQLICDPNNPTIGSNSTLYDPAFVLLTRIDPFLNNPNEGYIITDALLETRVSGVTQLVRPPIGQDFFIGNQTGYVQVRYQSVTGSELSGVFGIQGGYQWMAHAGVVGQNTHSLIFDFLASFGDTMPITYTNYADVGGRPIAGGGFSLPDRIQDSEGNVAGPGTGNPIAPATVSAPLVPEPTTALSALGLGLLVALRRRRRGA